MWAITIFMSDIVPVTSWWNRSNPTHLETVKTVHRRPKMTEIGLKNGVYPLNSGKNLLKNGTSPPSPEVMWSIRVKIGLKTEPTRSQKSKNSATEQTRSLLSCYFCVFNPKQACDAAIAVGRVPPGQPQRLQPHAVQLPLPPERHGQGGQPSVDHSQRLVCRRLGRFSSTFRETPWVMWTVIRARL